MFKLFQTFRVVYETKNFSKAAERLFISQPAVSNQIKQLEDELALELFHRKGRQEITSTKQADLLYHQLLNLADDWETTLAMLHQAMPQKKTCIIVASNTFAVYYLPELMTALLQKFPIVDFVLEMNNSEQVLDQIEKHSAHFGFIEKPLLTTPVKRQEIMTDELVHAGNFENSLWLIREQDSGVYHYIKQYFLEKNIAPPQMTVKNNEMILKCLEQGIGQSIISKRALTETMSWKPLTAEYCRKFYLLKRQHLEDQLMNEIEAFIYAYYRSYRE